MRSATSLGSPIILHLFSNKFTFTRSKSELKSILAISANWPLSRALDRADWISIPAVFVLQPLLNPCWLLPVRSTFCSSSILSYKNIRELVVMPTQYNQINIIFNIIEMRLIYSTESRWPNFLLDFDIIFLNTHLVIAIPWRAYLCLAEVKWVKTGVPEVKLLFLVNNWFHQCKS